MPVRHSLFEILLLRTFATDLLSTCYWALYCCIMLVSGIASGVYPPSPTTKALFPLLPFLSHCLRFPPLYSFPTPMVVVSVSSLWRFWASRSRLDTVTPTSRYIISVSASYVSFTILPTPTLPSPPHLLPSCREAPPPLKPARWSGERWKLPPVGSGAKPT